MASFCQHGIQLFIQFSAMFRHQTHPRNAHPYQTTVVPRTDAQFHHSNQQRSKYPWLENPPFHPQECQSTNSSNSENYQVFTEPQQYYIVYEMNRIVILTLFADNTLYESKESMDDEESVGRALFARLSHAVF